MRAAVGAVNPLSKSGHRECGGYEAGAGVGGVAGADLGLDQGAQQPTA
jgi:hypothetical protein